MNVMNDYTIWFTYYCGNRYDSVVHFTKEGNLLYKGNSRIDYSSWISAQENYLLVGNVYSEISVIDLSNNRYLTSKRHFDNLSDFEEIAARDQRIVAIKNNTIYDLFL